MQPHNITPDRFSRLGLTGLFPEKTMVTEFFGGFLWVALVGLLIVGMFFSERSSASETGTDEFIDTLADGRESEEDYLARMRFQAFLRDEDVEAVDVDHHDDNDQ